MKFNFFLITIILFSFFQFDLASSFEIDGETLRDVVENPNLLSRIVRPRNKVEKKPENCSDEKLRKMMHELISDEGPTESKRQLQRNLEGTWSIICAPCSFSFLAHSQDWCVHSRFGVTCLVYRDMLSKNE